MLGVYLQAIALVDHVLEADAVVVPNQRRGVHLARTRILDHFLGGLLVIKRGGAVSKTGFGRIGSRLGFKTDILG